MHNLRALTCLVLLATTLAYTGCSDDDESPKPPDTTDGGTDAGVELTDFVRDQINNNTSDTARPVSLDDKNLVDNQPANAFSPSFFQ